MVAGYLCGSIPFGLLIGKLKGVDLRKVGSGNIGATNAGRVLGKKYGLLCFALDLLKGAAPVAGAGAWFGLLGHADAPVVSIWLWLGVAVAAVIGHIAPVWLGFKGGKGVATSLGVLLGIWPFLTVPAVFAGLTWLLFTSVFRYVSLASVIAAAVLPGYLWLTSVAMGWRADRVAPLLIVSGAMGLLVIVRHRGNLVRLWRGTEPRVGMKRA